MTITIHAQGAERKRLVQTISDWLGASPQSTVAHPHSTMRWITSPSTETAAFPLMTVPTVRSLNACCSISTMRALTSTRATLMTRTSLAPSAFPCRRVCSPTAIWKTSRHSLPPRAALSKKALGVDDLPLEITDTKVSFPWFPATPTPDEMNAYDTFICKLCELARNQKRVSAAEKPTDNEKYAFRCFLLRLGFIGAEYKTARKILLKNLSGSSAFRNGGAQHEISE